MRDSALVLLALLSAISTKAAITGSPLGVDFSGTPPVAASAIGTDARGALYILGQCPSSDWSCVTKLAEGRTVNWQHDLGFIGSSMVVDPSGGVYVLNEDADNVAWVNKLKSDGSGVLWRVPVAWGTGSYGTNLVLSLTVDPSGRVYVAYFQIDHATVVRVKADSSDRDYMVQNPTWVTAIAADASGSAIILSGGTVVKLSPDGTSQLWLASLPVSAINIAADPAGDVTVLADGQIVRLTSDGEQTWTRTLPEVPLEADALMPGLGDPVPETTMDSAGNTYIAGYFLAHSVRNSMSDCGGDLVAGLWSGRFFDSVDLPSRPSPIGG